MPVGPENHSNPLHEHPSSREMIEGRNAREAVLRTVLLLLLTAGAVSLLISCGVNPGFGETGGTTTPPLTSHLVVTDSGNNRILIYDAPFSTDESASVVLGQPDFTQGFPNQGNGIAASANTLAGPSGLATDAAGDLYVADAGNCRVLEFSPPFTTNMDASMVIGQAQMIRQPNGSCWAPAPDQPSHEAAIRGMDEPIALAFDGSGNLWVADWLAGRVTEYTSPLTDGMAAAIAIGQPGLEDTSECNGGPVSSPNYTLPPTASTLCYPAGIAFDSAGNLWVADSGNGRVLEYRPPFSTGVAASLELGQPAASAFTSQGCVGEPSETTSSSLCEPMGVVFDARGDLWVADSGNGRVLEFVPPFANGMVATTVIGKANFTDSSLAYTNGIPSPTANSLFDPQGLSFDLTGNLIVQDQVYNRALIFSHPFSNGMAATVVLGQPNMTKGSTDQCSGQSCTYPVPTANSLWNPFESVAF